jgi:hypothetical protein
VYDYASGGNVENQPEVAEMAIREITMRLPETLRAFYGEKWRSG